MPFFRFRTQRIVAGVLAAVLTQAAVMPAAHAQNKLPALGDTASDDLGIASERQLGEQIMREIRRDPDYLDDPLLLTYVQSIWQPLVESSRRQGELGADLDQRFPFELFLVRDPSVNAFALPSGYVGVHTGLVAMTGSRDELAAVLAHELTHVTQRHIARGFANSKRQGLISLASIFIGVLAASRSGGNPDAANAVLAGGQAAAVQGQLNFSRDMEREADRIGYSVLTGAGYAPAGMTLMFEKLATSSRLNDNGSFPYLRSHPLTSERLGEARSRLGPGSQAAVAASLRGLEHTVAQAYARVVSDTRVESLRRWQMLGNETCRPPSDGSNHTGVREINHDVLAACVQAAVASQWLRDGVLAESMIDKAGQLLGPPSPKVAAAWRWLDLLRVRALLARNDAPAALKVLEPYQTQMLTDRAVLLLSAQAVSSTSAPISGNRQTGVIDALQDWLGTHPADSLAWAALSTLWTARGQTLRAVRADAESRVALGDITGALDRLRAGQALVRSGAAQDFIEASVIDTRARDLESLQKRLAAEQRGP